MVGCDGRVCNGRRGLSKCENWARKTARKEGSRDESDSGAIGWARQGLNGEAQGFVTTDSGNGKEKTREGGRREWEGIATADDGSGREKTRDGGNGREQTLSRLC